MADPWWENLFDETYLKLWASSFALERTAQQVAGVQQMLNLQPGAEILDLCCGQGRIAVPLAQAGYRVTGLDLSPTLLEAAQQAAEDANVHVDWVQADMRDIPAAWAGRFDAIINIFTAFGYFEDDEENQRVLEEVARALKPGGLFLIDVSHRDRIMAEYRDHDWFEVGDLLVCSSRAFDPIRGINTEIMMWTDDQGQRHHVHFQVHVYNATELTRMIQLAGLQPIAYYGDFDLSPFQMRSRRLIILARRPVES